MLWFAVYLTAFPDPVALFASEEEAARYADRRYMGGQLGRYEIRPVELGELPPLATQ